MTVQPLFDASDIAVWVNTCPQRRDQIQPVLDALAASDVGNWSVLCHEPGLTKDQISQWWKQQWIDQSRLGARFVLRIEDDVEVAKHLRWNLSTWRALLKPDLGVGALFTMDHVLGHNGAGVEVTKDWLMVHRCRHLAGSQMFVMRSSDVELTMSRLEHGFEVYMRDTRRWPSPWEFDMDCSMTAALTSIGRKTYLHAPSLGRSSPAALHSAFFDFDRTGVHRIDTCRSWMGSDWRRSADRDDEIAVRHCIGHGEQAWAVLWGTHPRPFIEEVFRMSPLGCDVVWCHMHGRRTALRGDAVFGSLSEAQRRLEQL